MEVSPFETVARSFLSEFPVDTVVSDRELQEWVKGHADGAAIKPDLAIPDPNKRISALRRHLNHGARSNNLPQDQRFQLQIEDAKNKTFVVVAHADVVQAQADVSFGKSVMGTLTPLRSAKRAIAGVKLDELPEIERQTLEIARDNIAVMEAAVKPTLAQEIKRVWVAKLEAKGVAAEQALKILAALPEVTRLQKLIKATD